MKLKIVCDGEYPYFDYICKKLFLLGYDLHNEMIDYDHEEAFYNLKPVKGDYIQISFTKPKNINKTFKEEKLISVIDSTCYPFDNEDKDRLNRCDHIVVFNSFMKREMLKLGVIRDISILNYFSTESSLKKYGSNNFVFAYFFNDLYNEVLTMYDRSFGSNNKMLVFSDERNVDKKINRYCSISGFSSNVLNSIKSVDLKRFHDFLPSVNCCLFFQNDSFFNKEIMNCMANGVSVIVNDNFIYRDFCKKANSFVGKPLDELMDLSKVIDNKSKKSKLLIESKYTEEVFFKKLQEVIGFIPKSRTSLPLVANYYDGMRNIVI